MTSRARRSPVKSRPNIDNNTANTSPNENGASISARQRRLAAASSRRRVTAMSCRETEPEQRRHATSRHQSAAVLHDDDALIGPRIPGRIALSRN